MEENTNLRERSYEIIRLARKAKILARQGKRDEAESYLLSARNSLSLFDLDARIKKRDRVEYKAYCRTIDNEIAVAREMVGEILSRKKPRNI